MFTIFQVLRYLSLFSALLMMQTHNGTSLESKVFLGHLRVGNFIIETVAVDVFSRNSHMNRFSDFNAGENRKSLCKKGLAAVDGDETQKQFAG